MMGGRAPWCPASALSRKEGLDSRFFSVPSAQAESRQLLLLLPPEAKAARPSPSCRRAPLQLCSGAHLGGGAAPPPLPGRGRRCAGLPGERSFPGIQRPGLPRRGQHPSPGRTRVGQGVRSSGGTRSPSSQHLPGAERRGAATSSFWRVALPLSRFVLRSGPQIVPKHYLPSSFLFVGVF